MSDKPKRAVKLNVINEPKDSYTGGKSSLCPGCGHDQISSVIINAAWENGVEPHRIAKMSGIGCSSKLQPIIWLNLMVSTRFMEECPALRRELTW